MANRRSTRLDLNQMHQLTRHLALFLEAEEIIMPTLDKLVEDVEEPTGLERLIDPEIQGDALILLLRYSSRQIISKTITLDMNGSVFLHIPAEFPSH